MDKASELLHFWAENAMRRSMWAFFQFNQERGFSATQVNTLFYICRKGSATVNQLAARWGVTKAAASQVVEKMVEQGFVSREEDAADRRVKNLTLTKAGEALVAEAQRERHQWIDALVAALSPEEKEKIIIPALELMNAKIQDLNESQDNQKTERSPICAD